MTRLSKSVAGGILIPILLFILIALTDRGESESPLVERHPFAWALLWPGPLWNHVLDPESAAVAAVVTNVALYAVLTFAALKWRENRKNLP